MQQTIYVTALLPATLEHKARIEAAKQRISRSELMRRAVTEYLARLTADNVKKEAGSGQ